MTIKFVKIDTKKWEINNNGVLVFELNLISSTISNKYQIVTNFIEKLSEVNGEEFDNWLIAFLNKYHELSEERFDYLFTEVDNIKKYVDLYFDKSNIDFSKFVDESKSKKNTIFFNEDEIKKIIKLSNYLKLYSIISNNNDLKLEHRTHKKIYNEIAKDVMANTEIIFKIFNIIKTKTFRYNLTDSYMWEYIKLIQCKSIDVHVIEIFNFIMNSILILCEESRNPITYFVSVVDESVKWFLRSVYKGSIVYDDSISTEDIHGLNVNNLKTYSYNDTLGRLKGIAISKVHNRLEEEPQKFVDNKEQDSSITIFHNRSAKIEFISPITECLGFPVISRITEIPFNHFKTLSPEHSAILSAYIKDVFNKVFKNEYENMFGLLDYFPVAKPAIATTYKIKAINKFINIQDEVKNFFGFKTKILSHSILSYFIGRISRVDFYNIYNGKELVGIPLTKVESEMIEYFTLYFSGRLDSKIEQMKQIVLNDF